MGGGGVQGHPPAAVPLRKKFTTHRTGGWVGPQGLSGRVGKTPPSAGFDPRTLQPVASHYTVCAILAC